MLATNTAATGTITIEKARHCAGFFVEFKFIKI
jgi:hypothetical protein